MLGLHRCKKQELDLLVVVPSIRRCAWIVVDCQNGRGGFNQSSDDRSGVGAVKGNSPFDTHTTSGSPVFFQVEKVEAERGTETDVLRGFGGRGELWRF